MESLLRSLLTELNYKATAIKDILTNKVDAPVIEAHVRSLYRQIEECRREIEGLSSDPALGSPPLIASQFQTYKLLAYRMDAFEALPLPVVQRFNLDDNYMTALCHRAMIESQVRVPPPLVCTFSSDYYWTTPFFPLIFAPALEARSLLGLPDLYHEIAHIFIENHITALTADFLQDLRLHVIQEKRRAQMQELPGDLSRFDIMFDQWKDSWIIEFLADMIATYLVGEAYGWQNIRLCSHLTASAFFPSLGDSHTHPSNHARMAAIASMLREIGLPDAANELINQWGQCIATLGDTPRSPLDYDTCYPETLIVSLAKNVVQACNEIGLQRATEADHANDSIPLAKLINVAWRRFLNDPASYPEWERKQIDQLRRDFTAQ